MQRTRYSNTSKKILTDESTYASSGKDDVKVVSGIGLLTNNQVSPCFLHERGGNAEHDESGEPGVVDCDGYLDRASRVGSSIRRFDMGDAIVWAHMYTITSAGRCRRVERIAVSRRTRTCAR